MKRLEQLLAEWEDGTLTSESAAELKQLLASPEARAELVGDWLLHEAVYGTLRAEHTEQVETATTVETAEVAPAPPPLAGAQAEPGWLKRMLPHLIWREVHVSLRWAAGAALAVCLLWLGAYLYFENTPAARVAELRGQATLERGGKKLPARTGQWVCPRDLLRVSDGGAIVLALTGEASRIELGPGTEFKVLGQLLGKKFALSQGRLQASVAKQPRGRPLTVRTPQAEATVVGTRFALVAQPTLTRLEVIEGSLALRKMRRDSASDQGTVTVQAGQFAVASAGAEMKAQSISGCVTREVLAFPAGTAAFGSAGGSVVWSDLVTNLTVLAGSARISKTPDQRFEHRLRGFISAPATGDYTFWIQSGQRSELWLSTDDSTANRRKIASMPSPTGRAAAATLKPGSFAWRLPPATTNGAPSVLFGDTSTLANNFNQDPAQKSAPQRLTAGQRYYVEVLLEQGSNDSAVVGWAKPGEPTQTPRTVIGGPALLPFFESAARTATANNR